MKAWGFICEYCQKRFRGGFNTSPEVESDVSLAEPVAKKAKKDICGLCLDVLNPETIDEVITRAYKLLEDGAYEYMGICFSVTTPVCLLIREASFRGWLAEKIPGSNFAGNLGCLKDAWKTLLSTRLSKIGRNPNLVRTADDDQTAVNVSVEYTYSDDAAESETVRKLDPAFYLKCGKICGRKYNERLLTRVYVQTTLDLAKPADIIQKIGEVPSDLKGSAVLSRVEVGRASYWLAGRYLKFSRELCQTPWIIDGVRKGETSLEEIVEKGIMAVVPCDGIRFSSSGREDVDVRCLGRGRPFLCQVLNARQLSQDTETALKVCTKF